MKRRRILFCGDEWLIVGFVLFATFIRMDILTTTAGLYLGLCEVNRFMVAVAADPLAHIGAKTLLLVLVMYLVHFIRRWKEFAAVCYTVMGMICLLQAVVTISNVAQIRAMVL